MEKIKIFKNKKTFWKEIISDFREISPKNILASGGSSANIFNYLEKIDLKHSKIFLADERFVSENHKNSNAKLIQEKLEKINFKNLKTCQPENFSSPEDCAKNYAEILPKTLDLAILGVGPDGHTCSLFPNAKSLEEINLKYFHTQTEVFDIKDRMTVSFSVLEKTKNIFVIMKGENKKEILKKITDKNSDFHKFPAKKVFDFPQTKVFFGDF